MADDEHVKRHKELHDMLDELVADFISHTKKRPSDTTVMELMQWSYQQTIKADELQTYTEMEPNKLRS